MILCLTIAGCARPSASSGGEPAAAAGNERTATLYIGTKAKALPSIP